jgi:hypothetical protein
MQDLLALPKNRAIQTHDIYQAAYLMASGSKLEKATLSQNGKKKVIFELSHPNIMELTHEYISGEGVINIRLLKSALDHLKGIVFEKMSQR